jgi:hypothetical protein
VEATTGLRGGASYQVKTLSYEDSDSGNGLSVAAAKWNDHRPRFLKF